MWKGSTELSAGNLGSPVRGSLAIVRAVVDGPPAAGELDPSGCSVGDLNSRFIVDQGV